MDIGRSSIPDQEGAVAGRATGHRGSPDGGAVSATAKRVIALGATQFAAFGVVLAVGWGGGPGHPRPAAPTPTPTVTVTMSVTQTAWATVTQTKTAAPESPPAPSTKHATAPDVTSGQGSHP